MRSSPVRRVVLFLILVFAFAALTFAFKLGPLATMWGPAIAALITSLLTRRSLREIGWKPWPLKWLAAGWGIPVMVSFAAYATVWLTGLGAVPNPTFLERGRITMGMPGGPNWLFILAAFGYITILGLLPNMVFALGTSSPLSTMSFETRTSTSPLTKRCMMSSSSRSFICPCATAMRARGTMRRM